MSKPIRRAGVIGAGVMGSGIASHFANAGVDVVLLDIVPPKLSDADRKDPEKRNGFSAGGLQNALKAKPAAFFHPSIATRVKVGNLEDDLDELKDVDLIVEAIIEKLDIKQRLFEKLEGVVSKGTIVASNTSGLRIHDMVAGRGKAFRENFLVMHFFNPVRYMKLLEVVAGPDTHADTVARVKRFGEERLGKGIVLGKDTPNFVANRVGCHAMALTMQKMLEHDLTPEDVDALTGPPMGHPKSASFRTADMVGLDTFKHVADHCYEALVDDPEREAFKMPDFVSTMVERGLLGNKSGGGFYKKTKDGILTFDPKTLEYRARGGDQDIKKLAKSLSSEPLTERVKKLVDAPGVVGKFAWEVLSRSMAYSANLIGEIADDIEAIDNGMKWGYNWELGPFETWDALGFKETYERMKADGLAVTDKVEAMLKAGATGFYTDDGEVFDLLRGEYVARDLDPRDATLDDLRQGEAPAFDNRGLAGWDLGDGVLGVTFKTKANSLDDHVIEGLSAVLEVAERDFRAMVIFNEGSHFSVGANLMAVAMAAQQKKWDDLRAMVRSLHAATQRMKYSPIPIVAAPFGMTVGGGLEVCLASDATQAYAETYAGLVEVGVGLIPGGGGNLNLLWRALSTIPDGTDGDDVITLDYVSRVFQNIAMARVATSAVEAQRYGYFYARDGVSFDKARHLTEAKARAVGLAAAGYHPPARRTFRLPGESGIATLHMMVDTLVSGGYATEHDALIARKLAVVLCGGPSGHAHDVTEQEMLELEAETFVSLCGEPKSLERMQHMLLNNKPLRN